MNSPSLEPLSIPAISLNRIKSWPQEYSSRSEMSPRPLLEAVSVREASSNVLLTIVVRNWTFPPECAGIAVACSLFEEKEKLFSRRVNFDGGRISPGRDITKTHGHCALGSAASGGVGGSTTCRRRFDSRCGLERHKLGQECRRSRPSDLVHSQVRARETRSAAQGMGIGDGPRELRGWPPGLH